MGCGYNCGSCGGYSIASSNPVAKLGPIGVGYVHNLVVPGLPGSQPNMPEIQYSPEHNDIAGYQVNGYSALPSNFDYQVTEALKEIESQKPHANEQENLPAIREVNTVTPEIVGQPQMLAPNDDQLKQLLHRQMLNQKHDIDVAEDGRELHEKVMQFIEVEEKIILSRKVRQVSIRKPDNENY